MEKKILFKGISPYGKHMHEGKSYVNGDTLVCDEEVAQALIDCGLAVDFEDKGIDVPALKEQIEKDNKKRKAILDKGVAK